MSAPIKRPVVEVERDAFKVGLWRAYCDHCPWTYGLTASKSDAEYHARSHRAAHRAGAI